MSCLPFLQENKGIKFKQTLLRALQSYDASFWEEDIFMENGRVHNRISDTLGIVTIKKSFKTL